MQRRGHREAYYLLSTPPVQLSSCDRTQNSEDQIGRGQEKSVKSLINPLKIVKAIRRAASLLSVHSTCRADKPACNVGRMTKPYLQFLFILFGILLFPGLPGW